MRVYEREMGIPWPATWESPLSYCREEVFGRVSDDDVPVRFAITQSGPGGAHCELGVIADVMPDFVDRDTTSIFDFRRRAGESADTFNAVLLVPTGIGAEIGGHAGDATPVARLLAKSCDTLITHPNVVNASDINELPENGLYVEGSVITRLLMGTVGLRRVRSNRVLLVMDEHRDPRVSEVTINALSAARAVSGMDGPGAVALAPPVRMWAEQSSSGRAVGRIEGLERLCEVVKRYAGRFDALALASVVEVPPGCERAYFESRGEMVNPWGGVEAMLTHAVSMLFDVPSAHAPMEGSSGTLTESFGVVDPRMAAEVVSSAYLHCVLKGLHRSPRIVVAERELSAPDVLSASDVSCLVIPDGCLGLPTLAALEQGIPVIAVRDNGNRMANDLTALPFAPGQLHVVDNYLEAVGVMTALKAGVSVGSLRRPLAPTAVAREDAEGKA